MINLKAILEFSSSGIKWAVMYFASPEADDKRLYKLSIKGKGISAYPLLIS